MTKIIKALKTKFSGLNKLITYLVKSSPIGAVKSSPIGAVY